MSRPMISLDALFDLQDRLDRVIGNAQQALPAAQVVLRWAADQGFLTPTSPWIAQFHVPAVWPAQPIPAGPQAHPEVSAAGDLNGMAAASVDGRDPEGAEGVTLSSADAPAPPVAGGGAPMPERKPGRAPLWTEEDDRRAIEMAVAGARAQEIAAALGRPASGTAFRLSRILKARIEAAKAAAKGAPEPERAEHEDGAAVDAPRDARPHAAVADGSAAAAPSAAAGSMSPAPAFDPGRPAWWKAAEANLNALGWRPPFTGLVDLQLVEELQRGAKIDVLAADMLIDAVSLKNRWRALLSAMDVPDGTRPSIEDQARLLRILRHRAGVVTAEAAE